MAMTNVDPDTFGVTPAKIMLMLRLYVFPARFVPATEIDKDALAWLLRYDLIKPEPESEDCYNTTARGQAWVKRLTNAGLPVQKWE